ncbi:MAG: DUF6524 family protein [Roseovarius sp.]
MFGPVNVLQRWLLTVFIVFATYNPSGMSFLHWAVSPGSNKTVVAAVGVALLGLFIFIARSTWRSMKLVGITITALFFFLFSVMLIDLGVIQLSSTEVLEVITLVVIASTLAVGLSFSAIRARLSGQIDSDDVGR